MIPQARLALVAPLLLSACDLSMEQQPRDKPQRSGSLWPDGPPRRPPPEGTIAMDQPARDTAFATPPPLDMALIERGRERYGIFCAPCHGVRGNGDGPIVRRGFPAPPSYRAARLVAAPPAHIVEVITRGYGIMYSYADRVEPRDRWAIAAYVKALQRVPGEGARP